MLGIEIYGNATYSWAPDCRPIAGRGFREPGRERKQLAGSDFLARYRELESNSLVDGLNSRRPKEIEMDKKETKKPAKPPALGKTPKPTKVVSKRNIKFQL